MALRSLLGKLQRLAAGSSRVVAPPHPQDKMSSSAFAKTRSHTTPRVEGYDEMIQSCFERLEKEARRQRRSTWKAILGAEAAFLGVCFVGLCYVADNM